MAETTRPTINYVYNASSRRYRDIETGRYVKAETVRAVVDSIIDQETQRVKALSQSLVDGKINLTEWQLGMATILKPLHSAMGLAAAGGYKNISNSDLGYLGSQIKEQYAYLRDFAKEIRNGSQPINGSLVTRSALYAQAARATHENMRQRGARVGGLTLEKSTLGPVDHCSECIGEAKKGWVPIGTLIPIGQRTCLSRCRCTMQYK